MGANRPASRAQQRLPVSQAGSGGAATAAPASCGGWRGQRRQQRWERAGPAAAGVVSSAPAAGSDDFHAAAVAAARRARLHRAAVAGRLQPFRSAAHLFFWRGYDEVVWDDVGGCGPIGFTAKPSLYSVQPVACVMPRLVDAQHSISARQRVPEAPGACSRSPTP